MAKDKLKIYTDFNNSLKLIKKDKLLLSNSKSFLPVSTPLGKILDQRYEHRNYIIFLASLLTLIPLLLITTLIIVQITQRIYDQNFSIFEGHELEILSVSIFGEAVGILAIITKSLWDDTPYKDILGEYNKNKKWFL